MTSLCPPICARCGGEMAVVIVGHRKPKRHRTEHHVCPVCCSRDEILDAAPPAADRRLRVVR